MECEDLSKIFKKNGLTFFSGVPDSTFKGWMTFLDEKNEFTNVIAANECEATAICTGYHLATEKIGVAYMQNSGLGKCVNPLTSLCDKEVYSIPLILMVGWRGEPGKKDEPQHKKMGRITLPLLECLEIPYKIITNEINEAEKSIYEMINIAKEKNIPVAIIIKEGIIEDCPSKKEKKNNFEMSREDAIKTIADNLDYSDAIVSTTGKTSRELFEYRVAKNHVPNDFYTVGSMGCASSIANAIALQKSNKKIFVFDGDGAALMQLGAMATIGHYKPKNLYHIIFDNNSHDSTGGQPTISDTVDFEKIALAVGYSFARSIKTKKELVAFMKNIKQKTGPALLVIKVNPGARKDLGRPTKTPIENKNSFMEKLCK